MDTTQMEELLTRLEAADPADAPDLADEVTATLAAALDDQPAAAPRDTGATPAPEPGSGS